MSRSADVVVVGGGIMGLAIALRLLDDGVGRVEVLERSHLGAGSSNKSGAILRQHYGQPEMVRLAREGLAFYAEFEARTGRPIGFERPGMLLLVPESEREALTRAVHMQRREGVPASLVDEAALAELVPRGFFEADALGCWEEDAGCVDAMATVHALGMEFHERGGELSIGEGFEELILEGDDAVGVRTSHGEIHARQIVLATGPWSKVITRALGQDLPLVATRAPQSWFRPPEDFDGGLPVFGDVRQGYYWRGERGGVLRCGELSTAQDEAIEDPARYDETAPDAFVQACRSALEHRVPAFARCVTVGGGCGLYTVTPDHHAVIGPVAGRSNVLLVTGFSGHGFKLAPAVARGVSEWIREGQPSAFPAGFFDPGRFERGDHRSGNYAGADVLG